MTSPADTQAPDELASFIDALGRRVTAGVAYSGLLVILTRTPELGLKGGHPALNAENATALRDALNVFLERESR